MSYREEMLKNVNVDGYINENCEPSDELKSKLITKMNKIENERCRACSLNSCSQKGHDCYLMFRSFYENPCDSNCQEWHHCQKSSYYMYSKIALIDLVESNEIGICEFYKLKSWLKRISGQ
jgi:hypothetical protein